MNKPFIFREISDRNPGMVRHLAATGRKVAKGTGRWLPRCADRRGCRNYCVGTAAFGCPAKRKRAAPQAHQYQRRFYPLRSIA